MERVWAIPGGGGRLAWHGHVRDVLFKEASLKTCQSRGRSYRYRIRVPTYRQVRLPGGPGAAATFKTERGWSWAISLPSG